MSKTTRVEAINKSWFDSVLLSKTTRIDAYNKSWFVSVLMSKKTRVLPWGCDRSKFFLFFCTYTLAEMFYGYGPKK